jgi:phosphoribosyl 1,2-cyclic phosphodiesterase
MLIRCWGSRGSIAVSGREFTKYGGNTTCLEIVAGEDDMVIIDAGTGIPTPTGTTSWAFRFLNPYTKRATN